MNPQEQSSQSPEFQELHPQDTNNLQSNTHIPTLSTTPIQNPDPVAIVDAGQNAQLVYEAQIKIADLKKKTNLTGKFLMFSFFIGVIGAFISYLIVIPSAIVFVISLIVILSLDEQTAQLKKQLATGNQKKFSIVAFIANIILILSMIFAILLLIGFGLCVASFNNGSSL